METYLLSVAETNESITGTHDDSLEGWWPNRVEQLQLGQDIPDEFDPEIEWWENP